MAARGGSGRAGTPDSVSSPPLVPPSPVFTVAPLPSYTQRRDHSTLLFDAETLRPSPITSPPASRSTTPKLDHQYGGRGAHGGSSGSLNVTQDYGKREGDYDSDVLDDDRAQEEGEEKRDRGLLTTFIVMVVLIIGFIGLFTFMTTSSKQQQRQRAQRNRLSPHLPASFFALTRSAIDGSTPAHPIIPLLVTANQKWDTLVASQSTTFDRASRTYRTRYGSNPPPGFDKWFAFATQGRNQTLVDEYDSLMDDLAPYRSLAPAELKRRTAELSQVPGISIVSIRNGKAQVHSKSGRWAPALAFQQMLEAFVRDLPDMDIAINEKPEGRVLPRQQRTVIREEYGMDEPGESLLNVTDPMVTPSLLGFKADWAREGNVWDTFRRSCPPDSPARRLVESIRSAESGVGSSALLVQGRASSKSSTPLTRRRIPSVSLPPTRELTFNRDLDASSDVCARPSIHSLHSAFFSDQRSMEYLYPIFSPSKPAGYADILIPSHHYWAPSSEFEYEWDLKKGRSKVPLDLQWADKKPTMYWRGKVTRGADTPPGHAGSFQKQRLVKMANDATVDPRVLVAFDPKTAQLSATTSSVSRVNQKIVDIAMACDPNLGECTYLRTLGFRVEPPEPLSQAWNHKYVLDLDEIGFSPSFLSLMESKSAVVKSSMQREFWRGWAVPWKHFIPLSSSYAELYNIQAFFSGFPATLTNSEDGPLVTTVLTQPPSSPGLPKSSDGSAFEGDKALQDIAEAGKHWRERFVRKADMECYVYRLMIEWAAIMDNDKA